MGDASGVGDGVDRAGGSAAEWAEEAQLELDAIVTQVRGLNQIAELRADEVRRRTSGSAGEQRVAAALRQLPSEWCLLLDRHWPGTSRGNIDAIAVGPGGVAVIDAKWWRDVRVEGNRLWRGDAPTDDLDKLLAQTQAVETLLADAGLAPTEVVPMLVLVGKRRAQTDVGRVRVMGDLELAPTLARRGNRLSADQVYAVVKVLDRDCPPRTGSSPRPGARPRHAKPVLLRAPEPDALLDEQAIIDAMREAAAGEPIESWMTWLHPRQASLVCQSWNGPARIRGAAGTGKTVVALHRAKYLAEHGRRVLVTSYVRTLPAVHRALFERLAPRQQGVEFSNVHSLAKRLLDARGIPCVVDQPAVESCFNLAWLRVGRDSVLTNLHAGSQYWREEIDNVIKSRGIDAFESYAQLTRVGRGTALQPTHREAVWTLYRQYEQLRLERGLHDWADMLLLARDAVRDDDSARSYDAVIVDEVQDLTCVGLQLLHALVGDRSDGLLLVGDGQQAVYPGGFSLGEAGISVVGRARVLERNYRNAGTIVRAALDVVAQDGFDDLEVERMLGTRVVDVEREGGEVVTVTADDASAQEAALTAQILDAHEIHGVRLGDMAVLCPSNHAAERWLKVLAGAGLDAIDLRDYRGRREEAVKVGTYQRAKGLEFAYVLMPDHDGTPGPQRDGESDDAFRERAELARRQRFVAMTRARDGLWLGHVRPTPTCGGLSVTQAPSSDG